MKPLIATLRLDCHIIAIYIDDLINVGLTFHECRKCHSINRAFKLAWVYYPSRQIYILTKTGKNISRVINSQKRK